MIREVWNGWNGSALPTNRHRRLPPPPKARPPYAQHYPQEEWRMKLVVIHESRQRCAAPPQPPRRGPAPPFSSADTWIICFRGGASCRGSTSVPPHLPPPPALSPKWISCAGAFVVVLQCWFDTIIIMPAPICVVVVVGRAGGGSPQSHIIRVSQWRWLEITTFFKRDRKQRIHRIWK